MSTMHSTTAGLNRHDKGGDTMESKKQYHLTEQGWVLRLTERTEFRRNYETAAWYAVVEVEAGDYPVRLTDSAGREVSSLDRAYYAKTALPGVCTYEHTPTLLFGSAVNDGGSGPRNLPMTYWVDDYAYVLKKQVAA